MKTTKQLGGALGLAALVALATSGDTTIDPAAVTDSAVVAFTAIAASLVVVAVAAALLPPDPERR